jgi:uncharacterized RDD family membrane protein YckC
VRRSHVPVIEVSEVAYPAAGGRTEAVAVASGVPAPHARRVLAWLLDIGLLLFLLASQPWWSPALVLCLFVAYHGLFLWLVGQTPGKAIAGLRVERIGREPTLAWALGRSSIGYLGVDLLGLGLLYAFRDPHRRCAHDVVFGSRVVVADESSGLVARLAAFAERHREAAARWKRLGAALLGLLAWTLGLARTLANALDAITPGAPAGHATAPLKLLSAKAAAGIAVATTAATAVTVAYLPPVADATRWLMEPRTFWAATAPVDALAGTWHIDGLRQVERDRWEQKGDLGAEDWVVARFEGEYVLRRGGRAMQLAGESDGTYTATWSGKGDCTDGSMDGRYRLQHTLRLDPLVRGADDRPTRLKATLESNGTAIDPAEARRNGCPVTATTKYQGTARRSA